MKFKGTKKEWSIRLNETIGDSIHNTQYYEIITPVINGNHINQIASCSFRQSQEPFSMTLEEIKANAELISAAPELLLYALCEKGFKENEGFYVDSVWYGTPNGNNPHEKLEELRIRAINKALGNE